MANKVEMFNKCANESHYSHVAYSRVESEMKQKIEHI